MAGKWSGQSLTNTALRGSEHLEFLYKHKLFTPSPSQALDEMYTAGLMHPTREHIRNAPLPSTDQAEEVANLISKQSNDGAQDVMLLQRWNGKLLAERFQLPEMEVEIERAVEQVEEQIKAKEELLQEKREIERAAAAAARSQEKEKDKDKS